MSRMGKARKIFNKKLAFPPFLFDKPRFVAPGSVHAIHGMQEHKRGADPQPVRIRLPFFMQCSFPVDGHCLSGWSSERRIIRGRVKTLPYSFVSEFRHLHGRVQRDLHLVRKTP